MTNTSSLEVIDLTALTTVAGGADGGERTDKYVGCTGQAVGDYIRGKTDFGTSLRNWGDCIQTNKPIASGEPTS
jgi:hypothetical protein